MPEFIRLDMHPAHITSEDLTFSRHRIIVTDEEILIYTEPKNLVHSEPLTHFTGSHLKGYKANDFTVTRPAGCACGSSLSSFHPFPATKLASTKERYLDHEEPAV